MRVLVINPNSDGEMTSNIKQAALDFAQGDFDVACLPTPGAPRFIETYEDQIKAAPGMISILKENEGSFDAFVVACHCDPNLDALREITDKPVVGIGEASMKIASILGHRFSVVSASSHSIPMKEDLIRKYHLQDALASVRAPLKSWEDFTDEEKSYKAAKMAVEQDMAEVIVLGCAGMAGIAKKMQVILGVPVLDGVACALIIATGLVKCGASTSKIRKYNPES